MTRAMREKRVRKYRIEDPDHTFQADYAYMLDDSGLELASVPDADLEVIQQKWRPSEP